MNIARVTQYQKSLPLEFYLQGMICGGIMEHFVSAVCFKALRHRRCIHNVAPCAYDYERLRIYQKGPLKTRRTHCDKQTTHNVQTFHAQKSFTEYLLCFNPF